MSGNNNLMNGIMRLAGDFVGRPMGVLVGKTIVKIEIDKEEQAYLRFTDDHEKQYTFIAEGDCCSESWFYHVLGVDTLLGNEITGGQSVEMGEIDDGKTRQEYDELYKITLITNKGMSDIEFRNSSNGYYGGWLSYLEDNNNPVKWNWKTKKHDIPIVWKEITEDYTA